MVRVEYNVKEKLVKPERSERLDIWSPSRMRCCPVLPLSGLGRGSEEGSGMKKGGRCEGKGGFGGACGV